MRTIRYTLAVLLATFMALVTPISAQDITVTVTPVQQVLPPQLMLYVTDPGNYFNVTVSNTGAENAQVYLVMQVEQVNPVSGLSLSTPSDRPSPQPIVVPAGGTVILLPAQIRGLFNHIPMQEIKAPQGLFDNYTNGSFGLLPEGQYELHMTAYRWENTPKIDAPVVMSSPSGGRAYFNVCYRAQAPEFLTPAVQGNNLELNSVAEIDPISPMFTWKAPVIACNPTTLQFNYSMRVVEVLPGQYPDNSMDHNPVLYQANSLTTPTCMIPTAVLKTMKQGTTYAAQVTATPANSNNKMLNYVTVENEGKSTYRLFRLKSAVTPTPDGDKDDKKDDKDEVVEKGDDSVPEVDMKDDDPKKDDKKESDGLDDGESEDDKDKDPDAEDGEEEDSNINIWMGRADQGIELTDSVYTFRVPKIVDPLFTEEDGARKVFTNSNIDVAFEACRFAGGEGQRSDTIKIEYDVQLFDNGERANKEEAVMQKPFYTKRIKDIHNLKDTIMWKEIEETAAAGDYMVLRIQPVVVKGKSVGFSGEDNVVDFAMSNRLSKKYFQCSNMVEIEDTEPTSKSADELKGQEVAIGEYQMIIDEISGDASSGFEGKGRVIWEPFGAKIKLSVKFSNLKINDEDIVYEGLAESYAEAEMSSSQVVDKLFSDWGIDNLIGDSEIPYAKYLGAEAKNKAKSLGESINIGQYYQDIQKGKGVLQLLTTGEMDNVHTPIKFPKEVFKADFDILDVQIAGMKFAPTYATMNVIAQSKLPECDVLKSKILVFGAPRLCISPNRFLPESGHIALLGDFTLTPTSDFELTFKAPQNLLEPEDGCYISWHADKFELLGIDADMTIPGLIKEENGKLVKDEKGNPVHPKMNLNMSIGSWDDFLAEITIDDFQVEDLPGYSFTAKNAILDLSVHRNHKDMGKFPTNYSKSEAGILGQEERWRGLNIGEVSVTFPKTFKFGDKGKEEDAGEKLSTKDGRLVVKAEGMFIDNSGITVTLGAENIISAKSKKKGFLGGWGISLDKVGLEIIQNNFDNCLIKGQLNVPIFDTNKDTDKFGNIDYTCEIRRISNPKKNKQGESERTRYSYMFMTESVDDLDFSFLVAKATLDADQTYFVVDAYDHETIADSVVTNVELCMGGNIGIGIVDKANAKLASLTKDLPIDVKIPDIHFTKMRLSNKKRSEWVTVNDKVKDKIQKREAAEQAIAKKKIATIMESKEIALGSGVCYLDLGEWSLASAKKTIGPFSFSLDKFSPSFEGGNVKVVVGGTLGLVGDKVCVGSELTIQAKANISGTDVSKWSIDDGKIKLNSIELKVDFAGSVNLEGRLDIIDDTNKPEPNAPSNQTKGYKGHLKIAIVGLFDLECDGGFFETTMTKADLDAMEQEANDGDAKAKADFASMDADDKKKFSWGYFKISLETGAGIQAPPIAINRIAGGFFFNCTPTKGEGKFGKFSGDPEAKYGSIGVALGLGMSTTAGEKALRADLDVLVVYDSKNKCLSTFMFNGKMEAVGGMIKADCSLVYENQIVNQVTKNRYLVLNVTVEAGMDTKGIMDKLDKVNAQLESLKGKLDEFQGKIDGVYNKVAGAMCGMKAISGKNGSQGEEEQPSPADGDLSQMDTQNTADDKPSASAGTASNKTSGKPGFSAGQTKISLEFKITWAKDGTTYNTPKWHLYLGEPEFDKRCSFTYLKIDAGIVKVDIGANAYICLGNELPNGGALPEIPSEIVKFLAGEKAESTDMGADLGKAQRSRAAAAKALLNPNSCEGGVMLGACAWGKIDVDLGLLYGKMGAMAGFDCSLVHYGDAAFCMNSGKKMGKNGWYAMGQLYAYLYAELGLHIKIGRLINERISFFDFGIGGVLEVGLPNPTWVEGKARIKISLLGGLAKINKKFEFSAGDRCIPFRGNALDGFEMVSNVNMGSDSLYQALMDPTFAISANEAKNMTFSTISSIGSHYRLLDPSYHDDLANKLEVTEEEMKEKLALNASRTYVFDITQDYSSNYGKLGVRLFDLGTDATDWIKNNGGDPLSESAFLYKMRGNHNYARTLNSYNNMNEMVGNLLYDRERTVVETSKVMKGRALSYGFDSYLNTETRCQMMDFFLNMNPNSSFAKLCANLGISMGVTNKTEKYCSFREDKGTLFHLTGMNVEPGHSYALFIQSDGYEIDNGSRVWCQYIDDKGNNKHIQWRQVKTWYFRVKSNEEEKITTDSLRDLQPYIALAYPSLDGTKVVDNRSAGGTKAYYYDIMHPTIALNRDITDNLPASKMTWVLTPILGDTLAHQFAQKRSAKYINANNCINLEPSYSFGSYSGFDTAKNTAINGGKSYDYNTEQYQLQLKYTYSYKVGEERYTYYVAGRSRNGYRDVYRDSTFNLVNLRVISMPHNVSIKGSSYTDDWRTSTSQDNAEVLPYSLPFVGARIYAHPTIDYEETMSKASDDDIVFYNKKWNGTPLRLLDPYLYFAYLGKWTFIGDRAVNSYDFDKAYIPFGTETLIYNYNGTTVNVEFLKNESAKSLWEVRNQMYDVWNTWNYNDSNQPYFPLPTLTKTVGGITTNNQDGKTSTVVPRNVNNFSDYTYCYEDLVHEYTAPWQLASDMSKALKDYANELVYKTYLDASYEMSDDDADWNYPFDTYLGENIAKLNETYRGRYIERDIRGFHVKVPYYQLPLIFGDCFGGDAKVTHTHYDGKVKSWNMGSAGRTFKKTIGKDDMPSKVRWSSITSNLLFFRLTDRGTSSWSTEFPKHSWHKKSQTYTHDYSKKNKYSGQVWLKSSDSKWDNSYVDGKMEVAWDEFQAGRGLRAVSEFNVLMYRVDAYNLSTGLYTCAGSYQNGTHRGGGTWWVYETIGKDNKTAKNLAEMEGAIEEKNEYLETHYDQPRPQCIYTYGDETLSFIYSNEKEPTLPTGVDSRNGYTILREESDFEDHTWSKWKSYITRVRFDASFKNAEIRSTSRWFENFRKLTTIDYIGNLNTSKVEDMSYMFWRCEALKTLDLRSWDVSKVKDMSNMFYNCVALTQVDMAGWNTENVTNMGSMFYSCEALTKIYQNFNTSKVEKMGSMFANCKYMENFNLGNFTSESLTSMGSMFRGCVRAKNIYLRGIDGSKLSNTGSAFYDCRSLSYLDIQKFAPDDKVDYSEIFKNVPSSASAYMSYDLPDKIRDQWPGNKSNSYSDDFKCIYGYDNALKCDVLIFIGTTTTYQTGQSYWIKVADQESHNFTIKNIWKGSSVLNTSNPGWKSKLSSVQRVYITPTFTSSPTSLSNWFYNAAELTNIFGLENLSTKRCTNMSYTFNGCKKLKSLKFGNKFKVDKVTTMYCMFNGCESLEEINGLYYSNPINVTNMYYMFGDCKKLKSINLGDWDFDTNTNYTTSKVTNMEGMFYNCESLTNLKIGYNNQGLDASSCTNLGRMFYNCKSLKYFPTVNNSSKVQNFYYMYQSCEAMGTGEWDNGKYEVEMDMSGAVNTMGMFRYCKGLKSLSFDNFNGKNVTTCNDMFLGCSNLEQLDISMFKPSASKLSKCDYMFYYMPNSCSVIIPYDAPSKILDQLKNFNNAVLLYPAYGLVVDRGTYNELIFLSGSTTYKVGDKYNNYYTITKCYTGSDVMNPELGYYGGAPWSGSDITRVTIDQSFARVPVIKANGYFSYMKGLTTITGLQYLNIEKAKSTEEMFRGCEALTSVDVSGLNTANVTNMQRMFWDCKALQTAKFGGKFTTANVENMSNMFYQCNSLTSLDLSTFNTAKCKNFALMFSGCKSLTSLNVSNFNTSRIGENNDGSGLGYMFGSCESLKSLNLSNWDTKGATYFTFEGCKSLEELDLSNLRFDHLKEFNLNNCTSLRTLRLGTGFNTANLKKTDYTWTSNSWFQNVHDLTVICPEEKLSEIRDAFVNKGEFKVGVTGNFYDKMPEKEAQVVWTSADKTLTFFYGAPVGSAFNGQPVTQSWSGNEVLANTNMQAPWINTVKGTLEKVVFDNSFINARPTSTRGWFYACEKIQTVEGFGNLVTSNVTDMSYMFYRSLRMLKGLDLTKMNTSKVTNMSNMFNYTMIDNNTDFSRFNTSNVTDMSSMFYLCQWADKIDLSSFNTNKVTKADNMFRTTSFKRMKLGQNFTFSGMSTKASNAFYDLRGGKLEIQVHSNYMSSVKAAVKNKLGFEEPTNGEFVEFDKIGAQAIWTESNNTLTFFYGRPYKKGDTFTPNGKTVTAVWSGNDVSRTSISGSNAPWTSTIKDKVTTVTFHSSFKEAKPTSVSYWFSNCSKLTSVSFISNLNTELTYNFSYMFYNCTALRSLSLSDLKTPAATSMSGMFYGCTSLQYKLNLSNFDTSKVTYMSSMFYNCEKLPEIDLSSFKVENVKSFYCMFYNCKALKSLDLSTWTTSKAENMSYMFYNCTSLTKLTIDGSNGWYSSCKWNTSNVTNMRCMFYNVPCGVSHSGFNMSKVTDMSYMFYGYGGWLIDATNWNVSQVTDMSGVFGNCKATSYNIEDWDVSNVTTMASMFAGCASSGLKLNKWNVSKVTNFSYMFNGCEKLYSVECDQWKTSKATTMAGMFMNCSKLNRTISDYNAKYNEKVKFTNWYTYYVTNMSYMFYNTGIQYLDIRTFDTQRVTNFTGFFGQGTYNYKYLTAGPYFFSNNASSCNGFYNAKKVTVYTYATYNFTTIANTLKKLGLTNNTNCEFYKVNSYDEKTRYNF